jgi:hypothetical protein
MLRKKTGTAYADMDASPTKAWMVYHRSEEEVKPLFKLGFDKRPYEELYDLRTDADYMHNIAENPEYEDIKRALNAQLMELLRAQNDPRVVEAPCRFEFTPYAGELMDFQK